MQKPTPKTQKQDSWRKEITVYSTRKWPGTIQRNSHVQYKDKKASTYLHMLDRSSSLVWMTHSHCVRNISRKGRGSESHPVHHFSNDVFMFVGLGIFQDEWDFLDPQLPDLRLLRESRFLYCFLNFDSVTITQAVMTIH